jgi:hypothetical protein
LRKGSHSFFFKNFNITSVKAKFKKSIFGTQTQNYMKSNLVFSSILSFSLLLISCKKEVEAEATTSSEAPKQILIPPHTSPIPNENYSQQPVTQNVAVPQNQVTTTPVNPVQTQVVTKPGMNPPHGQAGHRCDIAVGAPLNSPVKAPVSSGNPATITQQTIPTQIQPTTTQATTTATTPALLKADTPTAPGMNPPHGQAGHQCGIAVGAPLPKATESQ